MITGPSAGSTQRRYATGSIILHWTIAALIVGNIALGVMGRDARPPEKFAILDYHKSIGLTILMLSILRLAWRILNRPPALPATMPRWERSLAHAIHTSLYLIMIGLPLSGWIAVTTRVSAPPITYFGVVPWPYFPLVRGLGAEELAKLHLGFALTHSVLGKITLALLLLHLAGAVKHMVARDGIIWRMAPLGIFLPGKRMAKRADPDPDMDSIVI
ncbi:MAG: cytochrome b [Candidatus Sphingomonas phytovorans]|nr:cytochrome b [Sphingomonas sp.]WEK02299.1 MAG: cytochrome b [Sphingomonas sp.]